MQAINKREISAFVQRILDARFENSPEKRRIEFESNEKINFACPYCGDSNKNSRKKRGHLHLKLNYYKCYNGGCGIWLPIKQFIGGLSRKFNVTSGFILDDLSDNKQDEQLSYAPSFVGFLMNPNKSELLCMQDFLDAGFIRGNQNIGENSKNFIKSRCLEVVPNWHDYIYFSDSDEKAAIFNLESITSKVLGLSFRKFNPGNGPRFLFQNYTDFEKSFDVKLNKQLLSDVLFVSNYFNILNVDFSQRVTALEGQIDSLFVRNSFAMTGLSKSSDILKELGSPENIRIFFDRDKDGKRASMKMIKSGYSIFLWNKFIADLKKRWNTFEDIVEISKIKDCNDIIKFFQFRSPMDWGQYNDLFDRYFSKSKLDLIFL